MYEQLHQRVVATGMAVAGHAGGPQQAVNLGTGQTDRPAIALNADRLDRIGNVVLQSILSPGPATKPAKRLKTPVHRRRPQAALADQVLPIGDEFACAQDWQRVLARLPVEKQTDVLGIALDRGRREIGTLQLASEPAQPGVVRYCRRHLYFLQYDPPRSEPVYCGKWGRRAGGKPGNSTCPR